MIDGISVSSVAMAGASTLVPLAYVHGKSCIAGLLEKQFDQKKKVCVVAPSKSGKTTACERFQKANKHMKVVDLEKAMEIHGDPRTVLKWKFAKQQNEQGSMETLAEECYEAVVEHFKQGWLKGDSSNRVVFFTNNLEMAQKLFKKTSIAVCVPSHRLFKEISEGLSDEDKKVAEEDRENFIRVLQPEAYFVFDDWKEWYSLLQNKLGMGRPH